MNIYKWHRWFAWHPVKTLSGKWVFFVYVERKWNAEINFRIIATFDPGDYDGGWEYRLEQYKSIGRQYEKP